MAPSSSCIPCQSSKTARCRYLAILFRAAASSTTLAGRERRYKSNCGAQKDASAPETDECQVLSCACEPQVLLDGSAAGKALECMHKAAAAELARVDRSCCGCTEKWSRPTLCQLDVEAEQAIGDWEMACCERPVALQSWVIVRSFIT